MIEIVNEQVLEAIDIVLTLVVDPINRTRKGKVWDVWIGGRPVHVSVAGSPATVELAAGCNSPEDFAALKGHAGHEHNERCDVLAVAAANGAVLDVDLGYQSDSIAVEVTDAIRTATDSETTTSENSSAGQIVQSQQLKVTHKERGEPCRKCGMPIVKKSPKKQTRKAGQTYYYEWYLHCPNCKTMYMVEAAKRMITSNQKAIFDERGG